MPVDYLFFGNLKVFFFFCVCFSVPADKHPVNISAKRFLLALCFAIAICLLFSISYSFLAIYILSSIGVTRLVTLKVFFQNNIVLFAESPPRRGKPLRGGPHRSKSLQSLDLRQLLSMFCIPSPISGRHIR